MSFLKINIKRFLSSCIISSMLLSSNSYALFDSAFSYSYPLADGASYTRLEGKNSAGIQKVNYIEYTPEKSVTPIIDFSGNTLYGSKNTLTTQLQTLTAQGKTPIGATNADFFMLQTSIPIGAVIKNRTLISSDAWQYAVGFLSNGRAVIGRPRLSMKLEGASGSVWISYFNKTRSSSGIYLLDSNYSTSTQITTKGTSIVLERLDDAPVQIGGQVRMRVIAKGSGNAPTTITSNQMVLTMDEQVKATWVDYPVGEEVILSVSSPDPIWNEVENAVGGKLLLENSTVSTNGIDGKNLLRARTAIGIKADGTVVLYEVDGSQPKYSVGMTAQQLGEAMKDLGCVSALCLDGGGSSSMMVRIPGEENAKIISKPSDGVQRKTANAIVLLNQMPSDKIAKYIFMRPSYFYVLPNASTYVSVWGADQSFAPATVVPKTLTFLASMGSIDASTQIFKAPETEGVMTITASSTDGFMQGTQTICVTKAVDQITLQQNKKNLSSLSVRGNERVDIDAIPLHQGTPMASDDTLLDWRVEGDVGSIDGQGVFTASTIPNQGAIVCSYGATTARIPVSVGLSDPPARTMIQDFENTQTLISDDFILQRTMQSEQVIRGKGSLMIQSKEKSSGIIQIPSTEITSTKNFSLFLKQVPSDLQISAMVMQADGTESAVPLSMHGGNPVIASCTLSDSAKTIIGLQITIPKNQTIILDEIQIRETPILMDSYPNIEIAPYASTLEMNSKTFISAKISMDGERYAMRPDSVSVWIDGVPIKNTYQIQTGNMVIPFVANSGGLHFITIEAISDSGNRTRQTVQLFVNTTDPSASFSDVNNHWSTSYIAFVEQKGILKGDKTGDTLLFYPERPLRRAEFAVILARYLKLAPSKLQISPFSDAKNIPAWAKDAILSCYEAGVLTGKEDSQNHSIAFRPFDSISRAEVMVAFSRLFAQGYQTAPISFEDQDTIPSWATNAVSRMVGLGIFSGYQNQIRANAVITRAEVAKVLCLLY